MKQIQQNQRKLNVYHISNSKALLAVYKIILWWNGWNQNDS